MTIWERVKNALTPLAVPLAQNQYQVENSEYPDLYLVYSIPAAIGVEYADDEEKGRNFLVMVNAFSRSGLVSLPDVKSAMKTAGFTPSTERELAFNETTGHYGWSMDFYWLEDL
ncbi:hypothetical protein hrd7_25400 [Leptolinea sp. HRD-7]|nr:hypothetical protein hrd7_25400 [Leptolinea sp. HRD-7]